MCKTAGVPRNVSARAGRPAKLIVQQPQERVNVQRRYEERLSRDFRAGFYLGLALGLVILCAVLFLWAMPTVDRCVEDVRQMQSSAALA